MTGLLLDSRLDPPQRELAETIRACGDVLLVLLNDVLDLSKIEAGQLTLERVPFDLQDVVEQAFDVVAPRAATGALNLLLEFDTDAPTEFVGDPARLRQVLLNLLSNAVKFTERGEVCLRVGASEPTKSGDVPLQFSVRDTGIGISAEAIGQLFQPFSQVDSSISRRFGGTGLGLAISRRIVDQMGGHMWVESVPGHGSTFHFTVQLPTAHEASTATRRATNGLAARRILVVDDNPSERQLLTALLAKLGAHPDTAPSLSEARARFDASAAFDAIVIRERAASDREDARSLTAAPDTTRRSTPIIWISSTVLLDEEAEQVTLEATRTASTSVGRDQPGHGNLANRSVRRISTLDGGEPHLTARRHGFVEHVRSSPAHSRGRGRPGQPAVRRAHGAQARARRGGRGGRTRGARSHHPQPLRPRPDRRAHAGTGRSRRHAQAPRITRPREPSVDCRPHGECHG